MIGSLWTGISGLTSQQAAIDNEANNISNVNTIGFKSSRISFSDQMYQKDIGKGVKIDDAEKMFSQGNLKLTGVAYDMALEGDGFFTVTNEKVGGISEQFYTRAGNFRLNDKGELTDAAGNKVQGWAMGTPSTTVSTARATVTDGSTVFTQKHNNLIDSKIIMKDGEIETKTMRLSDYSLADAYSTQQIEDKVADYRTALSDYQKDPTNTTKITELGNAKTALQTAVESATSDSTSSAAYGNTILPVEMLEITTLVQNKETNTKKSMDMMLDTLKISDSSFGEFEVNDDGVILMLQDGAKYAIGQVSIARFKNNRGLEPMGGNMFRSNASSGDPQFNDNNNLMAKVSGSSLEMSNADLSESLVNMIIYQRAFEANAKSITTSDELLQSLLGLKR